MAISQLKDKRPDIKEDDDVILKRFKERVEAWNTWYSDNINNYKELTKFVYKKDGQWTTDEIREYTGENKPRLTFNMIPKILEVVEGEYSDFDPDIAVRAIDSTIVPQDAIDLRTNLIREIAFKSRNNIVYETATDCALVGGFGAFRTIVENESPMSFNKVVRDEAIYDPTRCFWDNNARKLNKEDGNYCGIHQTWKKESLKSKYPELTDDMQSIGTEISGEGIIWETKDEITVADYYEKVFFKREITLLTNGMVVDAESVEDAIKKANQEALLENPTAPKIGVQKTETRDDFFIKFYRLIHNKILERSVWDGKKLPIVFQPGKIKWYDGKEHTLAFIQWLIDTQKAYNFTRSEVVYREKLTRYEPYIAPEGCIEGYEDNWKNVYLAKGVLPYKEVESGLRPERVNISEIPQSLTLEIERSYNDFQRITGRFDANLGAPGNETSGVAILNRQRPGNKSVQTFFDNSLRAIETGANVKMDLIKRVFDTNRSVRIALPDGQQNSIEVNQLGEDAPRKDLFDGNDLRTGEFLVEIKATASFEIQRNAQLEQINKIISANPQLAGIMPDKLIELSGIKDAPALVKRAQINLIPQIALEEAKDPQLKLELTQKIAKKQQEQQQVQQLQQMVIQSKMQDEKIKALSSQMTGIANMMNAQTKRQEAGTEAVVQIKRINAEENRTELEENREVRKEIREASNTQL